MAESDKGCKDKLTRLVTVWPTPMISFYADPVQFCGVPADVNFISSINVPSGSVSSCLWDMDDGNTIITSATNFEYQYNTYGQFNVSLSAWTDHQCFNKLTNNDMVRVYQKPIADFTLSPRSASILFPEIIFGDNTISPYNHTSYWNFGDGTDTTFLSPRHMYYDTGYYVVNLQVIDEHGCIDSASHDVQIFPESTFYIPNAFTPDNNNTNDVFGPSGFLIVPDHFEMVIYSRFGDIVYQTNSIYEPWNGRIRGTGEIAPVGMYTYEIHITGVKNERYKRWGYVILLKRE